MSSIRSKQYTARVDGLSIQWQRYKHSHWKTDECGGVTLRSLPMQQGKLPFVGRLEYHAHLDPRVVAGSDERGLLESASSWLVRDYADYQDSEDVPSLEERVEALEELTASLEAEVERLTTRRKKRVADNSVTLFNGRPDDWVALKKG